MSGEREQRSIPVREAEPLRLPLTADRSRCLVIQTAFLGDVVLTTPLLSLLAERHGPVDVVTTPAAATLLETHPAVRSVIRYDKHGAGKGWRGLQQVASELRARRYATVYLPHRSVRSAVLAMVSGAPERVGLCRQRRRDHLHPAGAATARGP